MTATLIVSPPELEESTVLVEGGSYRHLFRARRLAVGDPIRLVDGAGRARCGSILSVDRSRASISVGDPVATLEAAKRLTLLVAVPKGDRASWLVEKATEVGVFAIEFVEFGRSIRAPSASQIDRLRRVSQSAVEQCGRARVPEIREPRRLGQVIEELRTPGLLLDPEGGRGELREEGGHCEALALIVGPEGGLEGAERKLILDGGVRSVSLGERILRTETAAVVAAGALLL